MLHDILVCDKCGDSSELFGPVGLGEEHVYCGGFYCLKRVGARRCELCGDAIVHSQHYSPLEQHGYGECVEMPDNFDSPFFDELRHRGVAIALVSA